MLRGLSNYEPDTGKRYPRSLGINDSKRAVEPVVMQYTRGLWVGPISVGTPAVQFTVNFDTGTGSLFLANTGCESCQGQTLYDPSHSTTAISISGDFTLHFVDGSSASGLLWTDTVRIGHLTATHQTLGAALQWTKLQRSPIEGIMGLGFQNVGNAIPVFQTLVNQFQTDYPIFAMKLVNGNAVLTLGGLNGDLYNNPITYVDISRPGLWVIKSNSLRVGGRVIVRRMACLIDSVCSN
jgi:cathepsin D